MIFRNYLSEAGHAHRFEALSQTQKEEMQSLTLEIVRYNSIYSGERRSVPLLSLR